jgi:hypothetical protein
VRQVTYVQSKLKPPCKPSMDGRIVVGIAVLLGGTVLVQIYRQVRSGVDYTRVTKLIEKKAGANAVTSKRQFSVRRLGIRVPGFGISGVDQNEAEEAERVLQSLNEAIQLKLDPRDPQSVQQAIRQLDLDIDAKIAPYRHNRMVVEIAKKLKIEYRQAVQKQMENLALSTSKRK